MESSGVRAAVVLADASGFPTQNPVAVLHIAAMLAQRLNGAEGEREIFSAEYLDDGGEQAPQKRLGN